MGRYAISNAAQPADVQSAATSSDYDNDAASTTAPSLQDHEDVQVTDVPMSRHFWKKPAPPAIYLPTIAGFPTGSQEANQCLCNLCCCCCHWVVWIGRTGRFTSIFGRIFLHHHWRILYQENCRCVFPPRSWRTQRYQITIWLWWWCCWSSFDYAAAATTAGSILMAFILGIDHRFFSL